MGFRVRFIKPDNADLFGAWFGESQPVAAADGAETSLARI
jgi:hypothetical protein